MTTLKLNSAGDDVKKLQVFLGLTADGKFGPNTEQAVKKWQKVNGLTADGIVGEKTWNVMFSSDGIIKCPLSVHITKCANRPIKYLAIHYTAGGSSKPGRAKALKAIFEQRSASADFAVDDTDMVLFNPDINNYYCWAVGDKKNPYSKGGKLNAVANNKNTISIEICSTLKSGTSAQQANHSGWSFTDAALNNAVKLSKILMKRFNIPLDRVVRHYDITGKLCPGIIGWNNETILDPVTIKSTGKQSTDDLWKAFKSKLS